MKDLIFAAGLAVACGALWLAPTWFLVAGAAVAVAVVTAAELWAACDAER